MQGQTNLYRRGQVYWFRKKVPLDLRPHYEASVPSGQFRFSLKTADKAEAKALAATHAAHYESEFAQVRQRHTGAITPLPDAHLKLLAAAYFAHLLEEDDEARIEGMTTRELAKRSATGDIMTEAHEAAMPAYDTSFVEFEALDFAASHGFNLEVGSRDARRLCVEFLKVAQRANEAVSQRNKGKAVDTPDAPAVPLPVSQLDAVEAPGGPTLESLRDYWVGMRKPAPKSVSKVNTAIGGIRSLHGTTEVSKLTKKHIVAFRDAELQKGSSAATVSALLSMLSSVLTLARRNDLIATSPADDVVVEMPRNRQRTRNLELDEADLVAIFSSPIYATGWRPTRRKVGEAAYFMPLIALYHGNRMEEIGQLLVSDVVEDAGGWTFNINNEGDKRTKNSSSNRRIPVHQKVIEAGLLEYIKTLDPKGQLFPELVANKGGSRTANFSTWFGEYARETVKLPAGKTFHSFRHTYTTAARQAGVPEEVRKAITGHAPGDESNRYGSFPMGTLREAQAAIEYSGIEVRKWRGA